MAHPPGIELYNTVPCIHDTSTNVQLTRRFSSFFKVPLRITLPRVLSRHARRYYSYSSGLYYFKFTFLASPTTSRSKPHKTQHTISNDPCWTFYTVDVVHRSIGSTHSSTTLGSTGDFSLVVIMSRRQK